MHESAHGERYHCDATETEHRICERCEWNRQQQGLIAHFRIAVAEH